VKSTFSSSLRIAGLLAGVCIAASNVFAQSEPDGEYLARAAGCITCHTADERGAQPLAGGREIKTPFGVFYSPNITPDEDTGIGGWDNNEFVHAVRKGMDPQGKHYYPAFPYPSYAGMTDTDIIAIKRYLDSLAPVSRQTPQHELPWYLSSRLAIGIWKGLYAQTEQFEPDENQSAQWNRGAYLVRHLGHCGECHSPRNRLGAVERGRELVGSPTGTDGDPVPGIHPETEGFADWSADDISLFLEIGMTPEGDFAGGSMTDVIEDSTSHLTPADRDAISAYLKAPGG
jgi:mono/diheme cytochrome c family protein